MHRNVHMKMQSKIPNDYEIPADFPRTGDDPIANNLRWQECVNAAAYVASLCFDAKVDAAPGSNNEILDRAVSLVCGQNFTDEETRWVARRSAAQLGW
jgi:hypothetical protein